ncbi:hypothetical protein BASA83_010277 [Batrachochytrium salamandrivorans]|nr:hypothetical protein BASA83_010277 [Batrachochytrium salamandrivorans]
MRLSVITLPICLIGAISANPHPTGRSGSESVSESESCGNGLDCESNGMYSNSGGKTKVPKGDSFSYKETTKGLFKLSSVSDVHEPKELQHPPTQEQSDEVIATPEAGSDRGTSDSISASAISDMTKKTDIYWELKNKELEFRQTKLETMNRVVELLKKSDIYKPKEATKSSSTWCTGSDAHEPKESQHPPTQEQSGEVIATPEAGSDCGASDSTGASAISGVAGKVKTYWEGRNRKLALRQTKSETMNRVVRLLKKSDIYKPDKSTKSSSTWYTGSDAHEPKESQHPPTQEQSSEVIATPEAGSNRGTSDSTSASAISDLAKKAKTYWKGRNKEPALRQTKAGDPKGDSLKPKEDTKGSSTWHTGSESNKRVKASPKDSHDSKKLFRDHLD